MVFQSFQLFPHLTVLENVSEAPRRVLGLAPAAAAARAEALLARVGLADRAHVHPQALSGGQQQRVALARAVAFGPRLMLLDEPLSNLDARLRLDMRDELARIQRESRVTMLYVTHDQSEALALSNRVVVMAEGRIEQVGTPKEIYEAPATAFVARFMGFETIADVVAGQLRMLDGAIIGQAPDGAGDGARLAWRPRGVVVGEGPHRGSLRGLAFKGDAVEVSIAGAGFVVKAEVPPDCALPALGAELAFDLPMARARHLSSRGRAS
jgi:putative spermidine/putrescine transport system ATP-binding protein